MPLLRGPLRCDSSSLTDAKEKAKATIGLPADPNVTGSSTDEHNKWTKTFNQFASPGENIGEKYLTEGDFVAAIAPQDDSRKISREQYALLFRIADQKQRGKVSFDDFVAFERLLKQPDAEFDIAFRFFDLNGDGYVSFDEFKKVFEENLTPGSIPFDFDAPWVKLYLGKRDGQHVLGYNEFTQLMKGLQGERLRQAFRYFDKSQTGYISPEDFSKIILELARHKLSDRVIEQLPELAKISPGGKISYSECIAFHNVIREMDIIEKILREACARSKDGRITREDFANQASRSMRYSTFSPMEIAIIFHFAGAGKKERLSLRDFAALIDPSWGPAPRIDDKPLTTGSFGHESLKSAYYFFLGGIAGALGAVTVSPIDVIKTRMQNQRSKVVGERLYANAFDCARKIYRNEGLVGFYRGMPPQLVGVAPEKAIKLVVNDLVRGWATDKETGKIALKWEVIAGGTAGGCQVVFTNPLEVVKIRLQMQGETIKSGGTRQGAVQIIKSLGLLGLYKGATACLCRDVPFSAIYFSTYAHLKKDFFHEGKDGKKLGYGEALLAASIAGMPAAYLTTPADVVKTRLQSEARKGDTNYKGVLDAFRKIPAEEGFRALFKGGPQRILRSSPQFGVTLVAYENLKLIFPFPEKASSITSSILPPAEDLSRIRARNALKVLLDVHEDFGGRKPASASSTSRTA